MSKSETAHGVGEVTGSASQVAASASGSLPGWASPAVVLAGASIFGVLAGLGAHALSPEQAPVSQVLHSVPVYACPGQSEIGTLYRGDRVYVVGQSDDHLAVRDLRGDGDVVFVQANYITADADTAELPTMDCDTRGDVAVASPEPSPSPEPSATTEPDDPTSPEQPDPKPAPQPEPKPEPEPEPEPEPLDTQAPTIANVAVGQATVFEQGCTPNTSTISAYVTDNVGVADVIATWSFGGQNYTRTMSGGSGTYIATFGPMPSGQVSDAPFYADVTVSIRARDAAGNESTDQTAAVRVEYCLS